MTDRERSEIMDDIDELGPRVETEQGPALGLRYRRSVWAFMQYEGRVRFLGAEELAPAAARYKAACRRIVDMGVAELGEIIGRATTFEQAQACATLWARAAGDRSS